MNNSTKKIMFSILYGLSVICLNGILLYPNIVISVASDNLMCGYPINYHITYVHGIAPETYPTTFGLILSYLLPILYLIATVGLNFLIYKIFKKFLNLPKLLLVIQSIISVLMYVIML